MADLKGELRILHQRILDLPSENRFKLQPQLNRIIEEMDASGEPVTAEVRWLNEELLSDAIEAQFDNMPV